MVLGTPMPILYMLTLDQAFAESGYTIPILDGEIEGTRNWLYCLTFRKVAELGRKPRSVFGKDSGILLKYRKENANTLEMCRKVWEIFFCYHYIYFFYYLVNRRLF